MADKTQVFPLEKNDSVRTRLTHSHEVSNLAKSMGYRLIRRDPKLFGESDNIREAVPVILSTIGLAHDLGNPPFGHQGEAAISRWFKDHRKRFDELDNAIGGAEPSFVPVPENHKNDFLNFEGNAQSLRLVCRLQNTLGPAGLDLTAATLAALMKYPVASSRINKSNAATKKYGHFASESDVVGWIRQETGLAEGQRHPLTWIMEAADDIAYSVLDVEDTIKKGLVSAEDLAAYLRRRFQNNEYLGGLMNLLKEDFQKADDAVTSLSRVREIKSGYVRTRLIERLIVGATREYVHNKDAILGFERTRALLDCNTVESELCEALKEFARVHAYRSTGVLELELQGATMLRTLMDEMWEAIVNREFFEKLGSRRLSPRASYVYSLISDSYRWHFENPNNFQLPVRYREMQLLTDMISGMTDGFAVDIHQKITRHDRY